jgi:hypothetical protein
MYQIPANKEKIVQCKIYCLVEDLICFIPFIFGILTSQYETPTDRIVNK